MKKLTLILSGLFLAVSSAQAIQFTDYSPKFGVILNNLNVTANGNDISTNIKNGVNSPGNVVLGVEANFARAFDNQPLFVGVSFMRLAEYIGSISESDSIKYRSYGYTGYLGIKKYLSDNQNKSFYVTGAAGLYLGNYKSSTYKVKTNQTINGDHFKETAITAIFKVGAGYQFDRFSAEISLINNFKTRKLIHLDDAAQKVYSFNATPIFFTIGYTF